MVNRGAVTLLSLTFLLVLAFSGGILAQSYFSLTHGNEWRRYTSLQQTIYLTGFLDSVGLVEFSHKRGETELVARRFSSVVACLTERKITVGQVHAVVQKWMNDNPDKWDYNMSIIMLGSLRILCP